MHDPRSRVDHGSMHPGCRGLAWHGSTMACPALPHSLPPAQGSHREPRPPAQPPRTRQDSPLRGSACLCAPSLQRGGGGGCRPGGTGDSAQLGPAWGCNQEGAPAAPRRRRRLSGSRPPREQLGVKPTRSPGCPRLPLLECTPSRWAVSRVARRRRLSRRPPPSPPPAQTCPPSPPPLPPTKLRVPPVRPARGGGPRTGLGRTDGPAAGPVPAPDTGGHQSRLHSEEQNAIAPTGRAASGWGWGGERRGVPAPDTGGPQSPGPPRPAQPSTRIVATPPAVATTDERTPARPGPPGCVACITAGLAGPGRPPGRPAQHIAATRTAIGAVGGLGLAHARRGGQEVGKRTGS
jgi:hypothetical protein